MDDLSPKFLLLQDCVGTNVERNILSLGLSTKHVPTQVLRGELLKALPEAEQPQDSSKIALGGVNRKSLRLECALDCLMQLSEEDANLLLAISVLEERYQTFMDRIRLEFGKNIIIGSRVFVTLKQISTKSPGVVWYKGELSGCYGTMFGVELTEHQGQGTSDGMFRGHQYFTCAQDSGVFVGLDKLTPRDDSDPKYQKKGESVDIASQIKYTVIPSFLKGKNEPDLSQDGILNRLSVGDRVVTFVKGDCPVRGTVRYIGNHRDRNGKIQTMLGLELDTADGEGTGKLHQKELFVCRRNFAIFVPIVGVIREEEFDGNSVKASTGRIQKGCENGKEVPSKSRSRAVESSGAGTTSSRFGERRQTLPSLQEQSLKEREREANVIGQAKEQEDSLQRKLMRSKVELENCQQQLRNKEEQLRGKEQEQDNLQRQLSEMMQRLANSQEQVQDSQRQMREREQRLTNCQEQFHERVAGLLKQLRENEQQEENSQRRVREKEQRLTNCQEQFHERVAGLLEQLRENEQQKENSQRRVREIEQRLTNCQEQLQEREARLQNSQRQVREMEQLLVNFERHVTENEAERVNLERQLVVRDQEINELETSLSAAQQTISELRRRETCDWVIARDEIQMKEKHLGNGGWGSVDEGTYCGCVVAVKQIYGSILSPHNRRLFEREMNIASRCRHPCLLQFIGATNDEGSPLFVTELMKTSLRALLEQRELSEAEICVISLDVARALNYLHQRRPSPILHRDVSSANVLLWRQGDQWRGKVSDYGTAKFVQQTMTVAPGALIYSSPEALSSNQTAMVDVYSFGVLLCEMCIRELPDPERRDEQVVLVSNRMFRGLVRRCLETDPLMRPDMAQIIQELEQLNDTRS